MKIIPNVNAIATGPNAGPAKPAKADAGDFERLLDEASNAAVETDAPQEKPVDEAQTNAQKASSEEPEAQELPDEPDVTTAEEPVETTQALEIQQPVVSVTAAVVVAEETAQATGAANLPEPAAAPVLSAGVETDSQAAVQDEDGSAAPSVQAREEHAKPQAAQKVAAESSVPEAVATQPYKPALSAAPQAAETASDADATKFAAQAADSPAITEAEKPRQEQQSAEDRPHTPPESVASTKPQAAEKAEAAQPFVAPPAGVHAEASIPSATAEASAPATAVAAPDAPRPVATISPVEPGQSLHAQRQELDEQRVAEQAMRAVRSIVNQRGGSLTIRLNPPELGELRIRLEMTQHMVSARLETSTDAVRQLLQQQLPQLHAALSSHGLTVDQIQVQTQAPAPGGEQSAQEDASGGRSRGGFDRQQQRGEQQRDAPDSLSRFQRELDLVA